ncbi:unnamed protein product [Ixodes pacificus]
MGHVTTVFTAMPSCTVCIYCLRRQQKDILRPCVNAGRLKCGRCPSRKKVRMLCQREPHLTRREDSASSSPSHCQVPRRLTAPSSASTLGTNSRQVVRKQCTNGNLNCRGKDASVSIEHAYEATVAVSQPVCSPVMFTVLWILEHRPFVELSIPSALQIGVDYKSVAQLSPSTAQ